MTAISTAGRYRHLGPRVARPEVAERGSRRPPNTLLLLLRDDHECDDSFGASAERPTTAGEL